MKKTIHIKGTDCKSCKMLIEDIAKEIPGIKSCSVDFKTGKTIIAYDSEMTLRQFIKEVESMGKYKVGVLT